MTENLWTKIQKIQYKRTPLFGRDSNPQNTSEFVALAGTVLLWLIIFLFLIIAKPFYKKNDFKPVQIVLSSTPVAKTEKKESAAAAAAPAPQATSSEKQIKKPEQVKEAPAPAPAKSTKKIADTPKKSAEKAAAKPAETKKVTAPAKTQAPAAPVEYAKSVEDLMAEQMSSKSTSTKSFNWDDFDDSSDDAAETSSQPQKVSASSSVTGTSGKANSSSSGVTSLQEKDGSINETASSSTTGALKGVKNATYKGSAGTSHTSELTASVSNGSGHNQFAMADGSSRGLIEPAEPRIDLSEAAANQVDTTINVSIFIEVQPSGNVTSVDFNPSSIVPSLAQQEIRSQIIGKWRFERADFTSMGKFQYTIKKL
ncbi:hypothetical protein [Treponema sp. C6A8]|uniref:hypothetical protein n=1 Tax=Treponema sp. C6A8 TaxID=1410609 RepID=UPI0004813550|nr:hypothetical protein [Treponema sp. C6A8]